MGFVPHPAAEGTPRRPISLLSRRDGERPSIRRSWSLARQRIPRGAIVVVVVGVIATIAAALLSGGSASAKRPTSNGSSRRRSPTPRRSPCPAAERRRCSWSTAQIQSTGTNVAGYSLFRVLTTSQIDKGAPLSEGELICPIHATRRGTLIAQSSGGLRMLYPRSSEAGIYGQEVPETVHRPLRLPRLRTGGARSRLGHAGTLYDDQGHQARTGPNTKKGPSTSTTRCPKATPRRRSNCPSTRSGSRPSRPRRDVLRTRTGAGKATVETEGTLPKVSPPINEEARRIQEEREAAEEAAGRSRKEGEERRRIAPSRARRSGRGATSSSGPSAIPLPTLFSAGLAGAPASGPGRAARTSRSPPRSRAAGRARPPPPRRPAGSPASGRGPV